MKLNNSVLAVSFGLAIFFLAVLACDAKTDIGIGVDSADSGAIGQMVAKDSTRGAHRRRRCYTRDCQRIEA